MFVVTALCIAAVSSLHLATAETVRQNASLFLKRAVLKSAGIAADGSPAEVLERYAACVRAEPDETDARYFRIADTASGVTQGYVFIEKGPGLWGQITAAVGLDADLKTLRGVAFTDHNETPGLGARISETWFEGQFPGKMPPLKRVPEGTRSADVQEFDAITGATVTSRAVEQILNKTVEQAPGLVGL